MQNSSGERMRFSALKPLELIQIPTLKVLNIATILLAI